MEKTIRISEWTWKKLWDIKLKDGLKNIDEVIKDLLRYKKEAK